MEIFEKLVRLTTDRIPTIAAQSIFSVLLFLVRPYRTALNLARLSNSHKLPAPLFVTIMFTLIIITFQSEIFVPVPVPRTFTELLQFVFNLTNVNDRIGPIYIAEYSLVLTVAVIFVSLCLEKLIPIGRRRLFRKFYAIAVALTIPWAVIITFLTTLLAEYVLAAVHPEGLPLGGHYVFIVVFILLPIGFAAIPILAFALQFDRRWNNASDGRQRGIRVTATYFSFVAILFAMISYHRYLSESVLSAKSLEYSSYCFIEDGTVYAMVNVKNRGNDTSYINEFYVRVSWDDDSKKTNVFAFKVGRKLIFDELQNSLSLEAQEGRKFRLMFSGGSSKWEFENGEVNCTVMEPQYLFGTPPDDEVLASTVKVLR
jgi:hypothetical protein